MRIVPLLAFVVALSGCYRITYHVDSSVQDRTYKISEWNHFFIFGLAPVEPTRDLSTICLGSSIVEVRTYNSPANVLSTVLSAGLSSGRTLEYVCTATPGGLK